MILRPPPGMSTIACLSLALWSTTAEAEKRMMTNAAFGCPTAYETSRVLQMRREGLGVDGHVTPEADKASRAYMTEHKCSFLKKGDLVEFEWSNVQRLEPETLGHAVCIRLPGLPDCAFAPKNFAEARSSSVQEDPPVATPQKPSAPAPLASREPPSPQAPPPASVPAEQQAAVPAPQDQGGQQPQAASPALTAPAYMSPAPRARRPRTSNRIELSPL